MVSTATSEASSSVLDGHRRYSLINYRKICLVGEIAVGKTTLFLRVATGEFHPEAHQHTIKSDAHRFIQEVDDCQIPLVIHDTFGLEKISALSQSYFKSASVVLLMFSVEELTSLHKLDDLAAEAKLYSPENCIFLLIGNKIDLEMDFEEQIVEEYRDVLGCRHAFYISAKHGTNVPEMFEEIGRLVSASSTNAAEDDVIQLPNEAAPRITTTTNNDNKSCSKC